MFTEVPKKVIGKITRIYDIGAKEKNISHYKRFVGEGAPN